jgi:hypothetical protein
VRCRLRHDLLLDGHRFPYQVEPIEIKLLGEERPCRTKSTCCGGANTAASASVSRFAGPPLKSDT